MKLLLLATMLAFGSQGERAGVVDSVESKFLQLVDLELQNYYESDSYRYKVQLKRLPRQLDRVKQEQLSRVDFAARGMPAGYESVDVYYRFREREKVAKAQVKIMVWQHLPTAKRRIEKSEAFNEKMFTKQWVNITRYSSSFIEDTKEIIGYVAASLIREGDPLTAGDLARIPVVEAGDVVQMKYNKKGLIINLQCVTRKSAARGEEIRVFNKDTRKTYLVTVIDENRVKWQKTL